MNENEINFIKKKKRKTFEDSSSTLVQMGLHQFLLMEQCGTFAGWEVHDSMTSISGLGLIFW